MPRFMRIDEVGTPTTPDPIGTFRFNQLWHLSPFLPHIGTRTAAGSFVSRIEGDQDQCHAHRYRRS
jgi:hypothetical protein